MQYCLRKFSEKININLIPFTIDYTCIEQWDKSICILISLCLFAQFSSDLTLIIISQQLIYFIAN